MQRQLIEWIDRKGGSVTIREVQQGCRWLKKTGEAELALSSLAQKGYGNYEQQPSGPKGGRPTRLFVLNGNDLTT